jgi:hypothetical protein
MTANFNGRKRLYGRDRAGSVEVLAGCEALDLLG